MLRRRLPLVFLSVLLITYILLYYLYSRPTYNPPKLVTSYTPPFEPSGTRLAFHIGHHIGDLYLVVSPLEYNYTDGVRQYSRFSIKIRHELNNTVTYPDSPSLHLGCLDAPKSILPTLTFKPYEVKEIELEVPGSCEFLETGDKAYWWPVAS